MTATYPGAYDPLAEVRAEIRDLDAFIASITEAFQELQDENKRLKEDNDRLREAST